MALTQDVRNVVVQMVQGTGILITKYPVNAAGTSLTASGLTTGAYKFAAAGANSKAVVAKNVITLNWRYIGFTLNTFSTTGIFVIRLGAGTAAAVAMPKVVAEYVVNEITAAGVVPAVIIPYCATVISDGTNDAALVDAASSNAGQDDTVVISLSIASSLAVQ